MEYVLIYAQRKLALTLFLMGFLTNRNQLYGYRRIFSIFFFNRGLVLDVKGQNPKAQPSTLRIVALRIFEKSSSKNPNMLKIRYLEIRLFTQKRPVEMKLCLTLSVSQLVHFCFSKLIHTQPEFTQPQLCLFYF